jgi:hypothetical protein
MSSESHATKAKTILDNYLTLGGFGRVEREAMVWPGRKFRADWFLKDQNPPVVIEYDGLMGGGSQRAHTAISNVLRDSEKGNLAQAAGFRFYRVNAKTLYNGTAFTFLEQVLVRIGEETDG